MPGYVQDHTEALDRIKSTMQDYPTPQDANYWKEAYRENLSIQHERFPENQHKAADLAVKATQNEVVDAALSQSYWRQQETQGYRIG